MAQIDKLAGWEELCHQSAPRWFTGGKFGIYTHWGPYAVAASGPNVSWYASNLYRKGTVQYDYHVSTFGDPSKFGYKDLIPLFTASKFNAEEWADLFAASGAQFAGPVGEHHDGFSMWDSRCNPWNAKNMGPKRDVVGELEKAIRAKGMKFMVAMHHAENWFFYPHWCKQYDVSDPRFQDLYGGLHDEDWPEECSYGEIDWGDPDSVCHWKGQTPPSEAFLERWWEKLKEVVDGYHPDLIWFDFWLGNIRDDYKRRFVQYYYQTAKERQQPVTITYKHHNLPVGAGVVDLEQGSYSRLMYYPWLTDTTIDDGCAWGYMHGAGYKTPEVLIHYLIDNVSKNGQLLLNVGPKADGTIPEEAKRTLLAIGDWLRINGEAIYDTTPWILYGEGPLQMEGEGGGFNEFKRLRYTSEDIRFTQKGRNLYAIVMDWPQSRRVTIRSIPNPEGIRAEEIQEIRLLGEETPLEWAVSEQGLSVLLPAVPPCETAYALRIVRKA